MDGDKPTATATDANANVTSTGALQNDNEGDGDGHFTNGTKGGTADGGGGTDGTSGGGKGLETRQRGIHSEHWRRARGIAEFTRTRARRMEQVLRGGRPSAAFSYPRGDSQALLYGPPAAQRAAGHARIAGQLGVLRQLQALHRAPRAEQDGAARGWHRFTWEKSHGWTDFARGRR